MDYKTWICLALAFLLQLTLSYKLSQVCGKIGGGHFFLYTTLLPWLTGAITLVFARIEKVKFIIFEGSGRLLRWSFLGAFAIGIYIHISSAVQDFFLKLLLFPVYFVLLTLFSYLGGFILWWGYLYTKLERMHPIKAMLIIGIAWGLWEVPYYWYIEFQNAQYRLESTALLPLVTLTFSPLMYYLRWESKGVIIPAVIWGVLKVTTCFGPCGANNYQNEIIYNFTGILGIKIFSFLSCIALILLSRKGAFKKPA